MVVTDIRNFQHHDNPFLAVSFLQFFCVLIFIHVMIEKLLGQFEVISGQVINEVAISAHFILLYCDFGIHGVQIEYLGILKTIAKSEWIIIIEAL
ncbi:MAG: hypothetical protein Q4E41_02200 [Bacteroidales bacterium]|nr:hypothetical protein [Bacteroidales bacterium]